MKLHKINNSTISGTIKSSNDNLKGAMNILPFCWESLSIQKAFQALSKNKKEKITYDTVISMDSMSKFFAISGKTEHQRILDSEDGQELQFKAKGYGISFNPQTDDFGQLLRDVREYEENQISLNKAKEYNVPHNPYDTDFIQLMDDIDEYEWQLRLAKNCGVDWDISHYNLNELKAAIDEAERCTPDAENRLYRETMESRI